MAKTLRMACGLVLALFTACERGPVLFEVTGRVTYDGKPLPAGQIFFEPDVSKGQDGPQGFAYIKDGQFDTKQHGRGNIGGPHIVRVEGFDGRPGNELPMGNCLFANHQETRELPQAHSEQQFEVPKSAK